MGNKSIIAALVATLALAEVQQEPAKAKAQQPVPPSAAMQQQTVAQQSKYPDIDRLIEKVKEPRPGLPKEVIKKLKNPFVSEKKIEKIVKVVKKRPKKRGIRLSLTSIFGNRARINGRWYKVGDRVAGYRLVHIGNNYVVLKRGNKTLRLYLGGKRRSKKVVLKPIS
ncbi:MAG: hypothetical protein GXO16_08875 [Epsilonproteobacteria bacterium]|nr:hypothetical protein [Campylobacterota bacterium]